MDIVLGLIAAAVVIGGGVLVFILVRRPDGHAAGMDQERTDYADAAPPSRPPSLIGTLALIIALTVMSSLLICACLLYLLWRDVGK